MIFTSLTSLEKANRTVKRLGSQEKAEKYLKDFMESQYQKYGNNYIGSNEHHFLCMAVRFTQILSYE